MTAPTPNLPEIPTSIPAPSGEGADCPITGIFTEQEVEDDAGLYSDDGLPHIFYDPSTKDFLIPDSQKGYVRVPKETVNTLLSELGYSPKEFAKVKMAIQMSHNVDYFGPLAGYEAGFYKEFRALIRDSPTFVQPCAGPWPLLKEVLENLLGPVQLPYLFGWLRVSIEMYRTKIPLPGQALVVCGPAGAGKNLLRYLISVMLGGPNRVKHPYQFMTGKTPFNGDLFAGETLAIEDESESRDIRARLAFGANIKMIVANEDQRFHRKYGEPITLRPLWRLIVSLNDDPERIMVLPPMGEDIEDKIMLFRAERHPMPMPTNTPEQRAAFRMALVAELPAFVDFLLGWEIPDNMVSPRYGVRHYHHPVLLTSLACTSPERHMLEMIDETLFAPGRYHGAWDGRAVELARELKDRGNPCSREAEKLLAHVNSCGTYLGRLERIEPERFSQRSVNGYTYWTIQPPPQDRAGGIPSGNSGGPLPSSKSSLTAQQRAHIDKVIEAGAKRKERLSSPSVGERKPVLPGLTGELRAAGWI